MKEFVVAKGADDVEQRIRTLNAKALAQRTHESSSRRESSSKSPSFAAINSSSAGILEQCVVIPSFSKESHYFHVEFFPNDRCRSRTEFKMLIIKLWYQCS
jgi:hypothetical protein